MFRKYFVKYLKNLELLCFDLEASPSSQISFAVSNHITDHQGHLKECFSETFILVRVAVQFYNWIRARPFIFIRLVDISVELQFKNKKCRVEKYNGSQQNTIYFELNCLFNNNSLLNGIQKPLLIKI